MCGKNTWNHGKEKSIKKTPRIDLTFKYGGENCKGKKLEMTEEEKETNNKIMTPVIVNVLWEILSVFTIYRYYI